MVIGQRMWLFTRQMKISTGTKCGLNHQIEKGLPYLGSTNVSLVSLFGLKKEIACALETEDS